MITIRHLLAVTIGVLVAAGLSVLSRPAPAQGDTRQIQVTALVKGSCRFDSAPNIDFGDLDAGAATDKTQSIDVSFKCTKGVNYTLTVGNGLHYQGGKCRMKSTKSEDYIPYDITPKSASGMGEGFQTSSSIKLAGSVKGADYQNVPVGSYADTVTLSVQP